MLRMTETTATPAATVRDAMYDYSYTVHVKLYYRLTFAEVLSFTDPFVDEKPCWQGRTPYRHGDLDYLRDLWQSLPANHRNTLRRAIRGEQ